MECESFLEPNPPNILGLCKTNLDDSIDSGNFSVRAYLPLIQKDCYSYAWSCSLCEYRLPLACIPVVLLKNSEPELLCTLAEHFNMYLKESCFPFCWKFPLVFHDFKKDEKRSTAKNYCLVGLKNLEIM